MIDAVFYRPDKPFSTSGEIVAVVTATPEAIAADGRPYVEVAANSYAWNLDVTHKVVDGEVVAKEPGDA